MHKKQSQERILQSRVGWSYFQGGKYRWEYAEYEKYWVDWMSELEVWGSCWKTTFATWGNYWTYQDSFAEKEIQSIS